MTLTEGSAEHLRRREISRLFRRLNFSPDEAEVIEYFSRSLVAELLDGPVRETLSVTAARNAASGRTERLTRL